MLRTAFLDSRWNTHPCFLLLVMLVFEWFILLELILLQTRVANTNAQADGIYEPESYIHE